MRLPSIVWSTSSRCSSTLESQLAVSRPVPGGADRIRQPMAADVGVDSLGVSARVGDGGLWYSVPVGIFVARR